MGRKQTFRQSLPGLWRILRHGVPYLMQHRLLVMASFLTLFIRTGLHLLEPWPLKFVFDWVLNAERPNSPSSIPALDKLDPIILLSLATLALIAIVGLRAFVDYLHNVTSFIVGNRVITQMRDKLYRHLQGLSMSFHTKARSGELILRLLSDVARLKEIAVTAVLPLLASALTLIGVVALMFWLQWQLTLAVLATVPLFWLSTVRLTKRMRASAR